MRKQKKEQLWTPNPYQDDLSRSQARTRVVIGGNRTGKTEWGAREVYYFLTGTHPHRMITPPVDVWVGTPSFDVQAEAAQPKIFKFIKDEDIKNVEYLRGQIMQRVFLKNGSTLTFKSYEQGKEKFQSAAKRLIWFDEEPPHDIWTEAVVRHEAGIPLDIILTMTPINGMTWVYDEVYQQAQARGIYVKTPTWDDNRYLTEDQKSQMMQLLTPEELEVRRLGRFVRKIGLVCSWWRRDLHIMDLSTFNPQGKTNWVGIDFGFTTSHTAALFISIDRDNLYIWDGIYELGMTTNVLAQRLKQKLGNLYINGWRGDSAAAEDIGELKKYGIPIEPVKKETGTARLNWDEHRARKMAEYGNISPLTNKPRLFVSQSLVTEVNGRMVNWFANEAENLRWKAIRAADGSRASSIWDDGSPKDALDALTYVLVSLPLRVESHFVDQRKLASLVPKENLFDQDGFY